MNKVKTKVSREANFIYHILSVSKCGYDNEYGKKYAAKHSPSDLALLESNKKLITVKGGEHCGELYYLFVSLPASLDIEAKKYYESLHHLFETGNAEENVKKYFDMYTLFLPKDNISEAASETFESYSHLKLEITAMCSVMIQNYQLYCSQIWETSKKELIEYANGVQELFDNDSICEKLETITGVSLAHDFIASFCNSLDGGAEAIDISESQDIFGISRNCEWARKFILHEYVIYLLKPALAGTNVFSDRNSIVKYWAYIEALAEFYIGEVLGSDTEIFTKQKPIIDFYRNEYDANPNLKPCELYDKALEFFGVKLKQ